MMKPYSTPFLTVHGTVNDMTAAMGCCTLTDMFYGPDPQQPGTPSIGSGRDACTPPYTAPCDY